MIILAMIKDGKRSQSEAEKGELQEISNIVMMTILN